MALVFSGIGNMYFFLVTFFEFFVFLRDSCSPHTYAFNVFSSLFFLPFQPSFSYFSFGFFILFFFSNCFFISFQTFFFFFFLFLIPC